MLNTEDVRNLLIDEVVAGKIHDTGYDCPSGNHFYEIRNVVFKCDKDYICEKMHMYDRVSQEWYIDNYEKTIRNNKQIEKCVEKIVENPLTRQAIIMITGPELFYDDPVCTLFSHIMLSRNTSSTYSMNYVVHMRSSDAIEFGNDYKWHMKIAKEIVDRLKNDNIIIDDINIVWVADSLHVYDDFIKFL